MKKLQKHAMMVSALMVLIIVVASGTVHATALNLIQDPSFETPDASGAGFLTVPTFNAALNPWAP